MVWFVFAPRSHEFGEASDVIQRTCSFVRPDDADEVKGGGGAAYPGRLDK